MILAGYAVFVFVAESFNPLRTRRTDTLKKRHIIGVITGLIIACSPLVLYFQPANLLQEKLIHSLVAASIGIVLLLIVTSIGTMLSAFSSGSSDTGKTSSAEILAARGNHPHTEIPANRTQAQDSVSGTNTQKSTTTAPDAVTRETRSSIEKDHDSDFQPKDTRAQDPQYSSHTQSVTTGENMMANKIKTKDPMAQARHDELRNNNDALHAALDEAEAEMRQANNVKVKSSSQISDLKEAKPILDPTADDDDAILASASPTMDAGTSKPTLNKTRPEGSLLDSVKQLKEELTGTGMVLNKVNEMLAQEQEEKKKYNGLLQTRISTFGDLIDEQKSKLATEAKTVNEAHELIGEQRQEIERARAYGEKLQKIIVQHRAKLNDNEKELDKSRAMASKAAVLARQAAVAHQKAKSVADQERQVRMEVESKAHKAVRLAENAISALAKEEQKNASHSSAGSTNK